MINELRELVRRILVLEKKADDQKNKDDEDKKNILTEPDDVDDEAKPSREFKQSATGPGRPVIGLHTRIESSFGGVAGVSTPLGTGPTFPLKKKKKKKKK